MGRAFWLRCARLDVASGTLLEELDAVALAAIPAALMAGVMLAAVAGCIICAARPVTQWPVRKC